MADRRSHIIIRRGKAHEVWQLSESATYEYSKLVATCPSIDEAKIVRGAFEKEKV